MPRLFLAVLSLWATSLTAAGQDAEYLGGTFHQTRYLPEHDVTLETNGSFALLPGEGLIWVTLTPFASTLIVSEAGLFQSGSNGEFSALGAGQSALELTILDKMLSGDPQALIKAGIFELGDETLLSGGDTQVRGFMKTPSGKTEPVTLRTSGGSVPVLREIVFWGRDAQGQTYEANRVQLDVDAADRAELMRLWDSFKRAHLQ